MKILYLVLSIMLFCSCYHKKQDDTFAHTYFKGVSIIEEYGSYVCTDWGVEIDMETLGLFCHAADYMGSLTGIKYHYTYCDLPIYESDSAVFQDVQYLEKWYEQHGKKITKEEADSIVGKVYEKYTVDPPNIDSVIARWDKKMQERKQRGKWVR